MSRPLTVREYLEESKNAPIGAPDSMEPRRQRVCRIVIDGVPFGEHLIDEDRYDEKHMLAMVLVSCELDRDIREVRTLKPRGGRKTPDFEATLAGGRAIRLETTEFADPIVRAYMGDLNVVFTPMQAIWRRDSALSERIKGMHISFYFPENAPRSHDRPRATQEILSILRRIDARYVAPTYVLVPPEDCPVLLSLDAQFSVRATHQQDTRVQFKPSLTLSDAERVVSEAKEIIKKKKDAHEDYSDGGAVGVWLIAFVADGISGVGLTAIQEIGNEPSALDARPFERLVIGNSVAGLLIEADESKPIIYKSLTEYREVGRKG